MENKKEITGIYNTTFNNKLATPIKTGFEADIEVIENAIIEEVAMYVRGYHDERRDKGLGAEHIKIHLEKNSEGYISLEELLNLGKSIREYTSIFQEPFIDKDERKIYEWENDKGVRFRAVSDSLSQKALRTINQMGGSQLPLSPFENTIITFYSDRNLNTRMEFKNIKVTKHYKSIQHDQSNQERLGNSKPLHSSQSKLKKPIDKDPDLIMKNYKNISIDNEILAVKKINDKKVGDVVIKNDNGTNVIFHANKTPIRNFRRFYKKAISGGDVHSLHISEQVCLGANNKELSGANALSLTAEKIIPQNSQFKLKKFVDKSNDEAIIPTKQRKR